MKKNFLFGLFATAMLLLTTACQKEADLGLNTGEDGLVTINLSTPEMATRAYSDGTMATRLQYAVYDAAGNYLPALTETDATINLKTKVELQLTTGNQYTLVFWAGAPTAPYTVDFANKKMTIDYPADLVSNREDLDAFYRDTTFTVTGRMSVDLHLYRPFAQLNIGTSDLAESAAAGYDVKKAAVTTRAYKQFNFITRTVDQAEDVTFGLNTLPTEAFPVAGYDYVAMNYILMTNDKGVNPTVTLTYTDGNNEKTRTFTNIPLQRNYRTNIFGQLFTSDVDVNVEIIPVYDNQKNPDNVIYVNNEKDLSAALTSTDKNIHVILGSDIDLPITSLGSQTPGSGEYKLAGEETENIIIDLNQKKLNITTNYWSGIGAKNANATVTIMNGTMTSSQKTGTWNSYDVTFANCNYVLDNVVFSKSIAFTNAGKNVTLKNVTINETHDYYAMWISAKGQNVTIDGLTINAPAGRGIKIDEQYVDAPSKVTMAVKNATFTTAKKAAIVVKSAAGADITLENVNLAGVAADNVNAVWVDEDAAAYAGEVTVTGGTMIVESDMVSDQNGLNSALKANEHIYLSNGEYTLNSCPAGVTFVGCGNNVVLHVENKKFGVHGDVTIENVKLVFSNTNYCGFQHTNSEYYKNCTIVGQPFLYGNNVTLEGCTFEQTSSDAYNVWTYGANNVTFKNCKFNSAGKSVLIYHENKGQNVTFVGCELNASTPVEGKAAIEIDSSLLKNENKYTIVINGTTANGFANGNVSGNPLWNQKKGQKSTITIDGVKVAEAV